MSASVGADIESLCSKCGDVWHVVVAKVGPEIVKVQCKQCGGYHRYRKPGHVPGARKPRPESSPARRSAGGGRGTSRATSSRSRVAAAAAPDSSFHPDLSAPIRPYHMRETFRPGEQISHPQFGVGIVEQSSEPGKIAVVFASGRRILAQAKPESTLGTASNLGSLTADGED